MPPSQMNTILELNNFINKKFNSLSDDKEDEEDDISPINCNYYDIDEFNKAKFNPSKSFSILHLNIHSIQKHIEELRITLNLLNFKFDIIALSESKIQKEQNHLSVLILKDTKSLLALQRKQLKVEYYSIFPMNLILDLALILIFIKQKELNLFLLKLSIKIK